MNECVKISSVVVLAVHNSTIEGVSSDIDGFGVQ